MKKETFRAIGLEEQSDDERELEIVKNMKEVGYQESVDLIKELTEESTDEAWETESYEFNIDDEEKSLVDLMNFE